MRRIIRILACIALAIAFSGCSTKNQSLPDVGFALDNFNTDLSIDVFDGWNSFKIGDDVMMNLTILNGKEMIAPANFNIIVFEYDEGKHTWLNIENFTNYVGDQIHLGEDQTMAGLNFFPIIPATDKPVQVFFALYGFEVVKGQITDTKIGAYGFVKLYPK